MSTATSTTRNTPTSKSSHNAGATLFAPTATNIIVGKVQAIYEYVRSMDSWVYKQFVAEVRVTETEKGSGINKGDLIYARYWQRAWLGEGNAPSPMVGQKYLPSIGETQRIHLARNAPDGFSGMGENNDGGLNVVGEHGFEKITEMKK